MPYSIGNFLHNTIERTASNLATHTILKRIERFQNRFAERIFSKDEDETSPPDKRGKPVYPFFNRPTPLLDIINELRKR